MGTQLSNLGVEIDSLASNVVPTGGTGKVLLYASGSGADSKLYVKAGADTQKLLGIDVESLNAKTGSLAQTDLFMVADQDGAEQNEQKLTFSDLEDTIFGNVGTDATIAAGGALTIADNAVSLAKMAGLARGKFIYGDESSNPAALALGSAHQFLQSDGTDLAWVSMSGDVTLAAGVATIGAATVHHSMLSDDIISSQGELAHADIADADDMMISDATDGAVKKVGVDSLRDHFFGVVSGDAAIADGGALTIQANAVQTGMVHDDVATELAQGAGLEAASGQMSVSAAQTSITSIINSSLAKIGTHASQEYIDFAGTANQVNTFVNNTERLSVTAAGIEVTGTGSFSGDLTVTGDLTINGTTTTVNSTAVEIGDRIVELNTAGAAGDAGLYVQDLNSGNTGSLLWDTSANRWFAGVKDAEVNLVTISSTDTLTNKTLTSPDINGGTADSLTSLTIANNVDVGNFTVRAKGLLADDLTSTRVVFAGANGVLSDNTNMTFATDTLTVTKLGAYEQAGAVDFSDEAMTNVNIDSGAIDGTNITVGSGKTLDVSGGTLTLAADQISGDKVEGGTIAAITINALTAGTIAATSTAGFAGGYGSSGVSINSVGNLLSNGALTVDLSASFGGGYTDGGSGLSISSGGDLDLNGTLTVGSSGEGTDVVFYGTNASDKLSWDASANKALFTDNNVLYLSMGGESGDYAIDVGNGSAANAGNRGKIRAAAFVTYSDRNLKKDIAPMNDALDKVMKLDAVSYKMKNDNRQEIGFIAQDVAKVVPEVCALDADGVGRGIDYSRMSALLAGAVKSQQLQIEELKTIITKLQK